MNKNLKMLVSIAAIVVILVVNFLFTELVKSNPSLKLSLNSGNVSLTSETINYMKNVSKPVNFKIIVTEQDMAHPVIIQFKKIVNQLVAANKNITLSEIPYNSEEDMPNIEKYLQLAQTNQEQLTPITIIMEEGEQTALATPEIDEEMQDYNFSTYEGVVVNKLRSILDPSAAEITIPSNDIGYKEPEPFEMSSKKKNSLVAVYMILIPAIFFALACFLSRKKCCA